jgi:hypothetical protein
MKKALVICSLALAVSSANAADFRTSIPLNVDASKPNSEVYTIGLSPFAISIIHKKNIAPSFKVAIEQELSKQEKGGYATQVTQKSYNKQHYEAVEFTRHTEYGNMYYFIYQAKGKANINAIMLQTNRRIEPESEKAFKEYRKIIDNL